MKEDIKQACKILEEGGLILYPTDTIWGIGCDATNPDAVAKVYALKQRSDSKALICLVDSPVKIDFYVSDPPEIAFDLIEIADKPTTIIYDGARNLAPNLIAEDGSIAIRVTQEKVSQALCQRFRKALVSTSANISGATSPSCFQEISQEIIDGVDYILPLRQDEPPGAKASSIIKLGRGGQIKIIRQ